MHFIITYIAIIDLIALRFISGLKGKNLADLLLKRKYPTTVSVQHNQ